jgi:hypothetical protein
LGARTLKSGQSRWFVGYKKHTLRLWLNGYAPSVQLVPLISWVAPANRNEVQLLWPSLHYCAHRLNWLPDLVVGDKSYIHLEVQRRIRERWGVGVLTRLRADMKLMAPFEAGPQAVCPQGQPLEWLGYEVADQLHWFGVVQTQPLCPWCWEQGACPRQFSYRPSEHEILLGRLPLALPVTQRLLQQVRPWIEATQSYEKNRLGLSAMFLNSLRLSWTVCLLADAVCLLRAQALLTYPQKPALLHELTPQQLVFDWSED